MYDDLDKRFALRLTPAEHEWVRARAYTVRRSMNAVLRDALAFYRKHHPDTLRDKFRRVIGGDV